MKRRLGTIGAVMAVGLFAVAQPAGASWGQQDAVTPSGSTAALGGVDCWGPNYCEAVGSYDTSAGTLTLAEFRSGNTWSVQSTPNPSGTNNSYLAAVSCSQSNACTAVGEYGTGASYAAFAERWGGSGWTLETTVTPSGATTVYLNAVSCKSATLCIAVGSATVGTNTSLLVERWNGSGWSIMTAPSPSGGTDASLNGISCTSTTLCTAAGGYSSGSSQLSLAERWNGSTWTVQTTANPSGSPSFASLSGVSCSSSTSCDAVGSSLAEGWNGTTWTLQTVAKLPGTSSGPADLTSVQCSSATACYGVGFYYVEGVQTLATETWNGHHWMGPDAGLDTSAESSSLEAISCPTAYACTAVGSYLDPVDGTRALAEVFQLQWSQQYLPDPSGSISGGLNSVSCASAKVCMAVGNYEGSGSTFFSLGEEWNGSSWVSQAVPDASTTYLSGVACPSTTYCIAVGDHASGSGLLSRAQVWNGTTWSDQTTPNPSGTKGSFFNAIACTSTSACTAVGAYRHSSGPELTLVERWNGATWSVQSSPNPTGTTESSFGGVACATSTMCMAVGDNLSPGNSMLAETWNGTSWTIQPTPLPSGGGDGVLNAVSCPSATRCEAIGGYFVGSKDEPLVQEWTGASFVAEATALPGGAKDTYLVGVSCVSTTVCNAVGEYSKSGGEFQALAENFNGTEWVVKPSATPGTEGTQLDSDSCYSVTGCITVGDYNDSSGFEHLLAEQYG